MKKVKEGITYIVCGEVKEICTVENAENRGKRWRNVDVMEERILEVGNKEIII